MKSSFLFQFRSTLQTRLRPVRPKTPNNSPNHNVLLVVSNRAASSTARPVHPLLPRNCSTHLLPPVPPSRSSPLPLAFEKRTVNSSPPRLKIYLYLYIYISPASLFRQILIFMYHFFAFSQNLKSRTPPWTRKSCSST